MDGVVGCGESLEGAPGGRKVAKYCDFSEISRFRGPVLTVCLQDCTIRTLDRPLHPLEQARAAGRAAAWRERWLAVVASCFFISAVSYPMWRKVVPATHAPLDGSADTMGGWGYLLGS